MANGINLEYPISTPPIQPEKWQGQIISLSPRKYRFCTLEPFSNGELEAGVVVTGEVDSLGFLRVNKPTTTGAKILGVTVLNFQRILLWDNDLNCFKYMNNDMVTLITEGDIVMFSESSANPGDPVYFRYAADVNLPTIGAISNTSGNGKDLLPGAKFLDKLSNPGLVRVGLNY